MSLMRQLGSGWRSLRDWTPNYASAPPADLTAALRKFGGSVIRCLARSLMGGSRRLKPRPIFPGGFREAVTGCIRLELMRLTELDSSIERAVEDHCWGV